MAIHMQIHFHVFDDIAVPLKEILPTVGGAQISLAGTAPAISTSYH